MQFLKAFATPPSVLAPGSCDAVRLRSSLLLAGASPELVQSGEESEAKQAAYQRGRAAWLASIGYRAEGD